MLAENNEPPRVVVPSVSSNANEVRELLFSEINGDVAVLARKPPLLTKIMSSLNEAVLVVASDSSGPAIFTVVVLRHLYSNRLETLFRELFVSDTKGWVVVLVNVPPSNLMSLR